jgi:hypothetical protein
MKPTCAVVFLALIAALGCSSPEAVDHRDDDGVILAVRMQTGPSIAVDPSLVLQLDRLIRVARTASPTVLSGIHARPDVALNTMSLRVTGGVAAAFGRGELRTGISALDALLANFQLVAARSPPVPDGYFALQFKQPLRTAQLAAAIKALGIAEIVDAAPEGIVGDGDNLFAIHEAGGWVIKFIHGEGDCPAGCTEHTETDVLVGDDGGVHLLDPH